MTQAEVEFALDSNQNSGLEFCCQLGAQFLRGEVKIPPPKSLGGVSGRCRFREKRKISPGLLAGIARDGIKGGKGSSEEFQVDPRVPKQQKKNLWEASLEGSGAVPAISAASRRGEGGSKVAFPLFSRATKIQIPFLRQTPCDGMNTQSARKVSEPISKHISAPALLFLVPSRSRQHLQHLSRSPQNPLPCPKP